MIYANSSVPSGITGIISGTGRNFPKASQSQPVVHSHLAGKGLSFVLECCSVFLLLRSTPLPTLPPAKTTYLLGPSEHPQWHWATLQKSNSDPLSSTEVEKWEDITEQRRRKEGSMYYPSTECPAQTEALLKGCIFNHTMTLGSRHYHHCFTC